MTQQIPQTKQLIFCYSQHSPHSLVMLYSQEQVLSNMLESPDKQYFLWVIAQVDEPLRHKLSQIQQESSVAIMTFTCLQSVAEFLGRNNQFKNLTIICQPKLVKDINKLDRRKQISIIIQYPAQFISFDELSQQNNLNEQDQSSKNYTLLKATNQSSLLNLIKKYSEAKAREYKQLMNFVPIQHDIQKSNVLVETMLAIINQEIDLCTRRQIVDEFSKLATKIDGLNNFQLLVKELKQGPLCLSRAIYWYTDEQAGVYRLINNLLRSSSHPSEVFYIQPLIKDIFAAIQKLYKEQKQSFVCYRGGLLTKTEILELQKNVGHIVKNLSFLSTTLNQEKAMGFKQNVIFEIKVPQYQELQKQYKFGYGYAKIKLFSSFYGEEQILFNPLCSFKILEIKQLFNDNLGSSQFYISLQYGGLPKILKKMEFNQKLLSKSERLLLDLGKIWKKQQDEIKNQGDALIGFNYDLEDVLKYWQKYEEIAKNRPQKIDGLIKLGRLQESNSTQSIKIYTKAIQLYTQEYGSFEIQKIYNKNQKTVLDLAQIHQYFRLRKCLLASFLDMGKYEQVQQMCEAEMKCLHKQSQQYQNIVDSLASSYFALGQYEKALSLYLQICQTQKSQIVQYQNVSVKYLIKLADTYRCLGKAEHARNLLQDCLKMLLFTVGERNPAYRQCLKVMAATLTDLGQFKKAQQLFEKCCMITREKQGIQNEYYVQLINNFACFLNQTGQSLKAQQLCQKSEQICDGNYENSQQFLFRYIQSLNRLASILTTQSKFQQAYGKISKSYKLCLQFFGEKYIVTLRTAIRLGQILCELNKLKQAQQVMEKCCKILLETVGQKHWEFLTAQKTLSNIYRLTKKYPKSLQLIQNCLNSYSELKGKNSLDYFVTLNNYAQVLTDMKQYEQAATIYEQCHRFFVQFLGQHHPKTICTYQSLGYILLCQGKYKQALPIYQNCYNLSKQILTKSHSNPISISISISSNLTLLYLQTGEYQNTLQISQICNQILQQKQHPKQHNCLSMIITLLLNIGRYQQALTIAKQLLTLLPTDYSTKYRGLIIRVLEIFGDIC